MKPFITYYLKAIKHLQSILVIGSIGVFLLALPTVMALTPESLPSNIKITLYFISYAAVTFVMSIRPLADIFPRFRYLRMLVPLRKGFGILSSSIIVSFMLVKIITFGSTYLGDFLTLKYWRFSDSSIFAHLGDVTAVILLATSNVLSKKVLGKNWKRIQKLAYVYFYAGGIYEVLVFHDIFAGYSMVVVSFLLALAFIIKIIKK